MTSPPSASVNLEAGRVFLVNMVFAPYAFDRCGEVAMLLALSDVAVGGYGPDVFRPAGEFDEFRCGCDEIAGPSDLRAPEFEEGDLPAAGVPRNAVRYEYDMRV